MGEFLSGYHLLPSIRHNTVKMLKQENKIKRGRAFRRYARVRGSTSTLEGPENIEIAREAGYTQKYNSANREKSVPKQI